MGECMDDEWVNEEGDSFLFDFSRGNKGIYNTIEQRYACILCFKVCTYVHDDTREWMGSSVCGNDERERAVSSFFFSLFFLIFSFFGRIEKKKSWPKEIANATDRDAFLRLRIFFLPLWILLLLLWIEEDEKIKNKVKKVRNFEERERREMKTSIYYIASNSLQPSNVSKAWKGMRGKKKGGRGRRIIGK